MKTLYDVLGVSAEATTEQIENAYKFAFESLSNSNRSAEENLIKGRALKEAYSVLSSPNRREAYDAKLKGKSQVTYQVVEKAGFPWIQMACAFLLIGGCFIFYKVQSHKAEVERAALAAAKAKAEAEQAEKLAEAEKIRLEQSRLEAQRQDEARQRFETERVRIEGQYVHSKNQMAEERATREKAQSERQAQYEKRQAQYEKQREEQAAAARSRNEVAAMRRALDMPISRR